MNTLTKRLALVALGTLLSGAALMAQDAKPAAPRVQARKAPIVKGVKHRKPAVKKAARPQKQDAQTRK